MLRRRKSRFNEVIMKMSLFVYFSICIFFIGELRAKESNQIFIDAIRVLRVQLSIYKYASENRNPFKPSTFLNKKKREKFNIFLDDPLRSASLEDYKLVGLVWKTKIPKAIIQDTEGKTHILKNGDYLGDKQGQIINIREGEVVILELIEKEDGSGTLYKTNVLTFSEIFLEGQKKRNRTGRNKKKRNK